VVKNTLTKLAAKEAGVDGLQDQLVGPSAIAFVKGDPVEAAKGLRDFSRANPVLVIKGGVLDGKLLTADEIRKLADLESREVLLAKLAGAMKASMSNAAATFAAPLAQTARLVEALGQKQAEASTSAEAPSDSAEASTSAEASDDSAEAGTSAEAPSDSAEAGTSAEASSDSAEATDQTEG
jgi:large subunit ribosomal protein L10